MTINDQIRDEKLQHDINREAAKISALSSGKIQVWVFHWWRYITIQSTTKNWTNKIYLFSFWKKKKTIEEQDQKQIDALENLKDQNKQLLNVDVNDDYENKLLHSKEQEIFRKIYNKRLDKIDEVTKRLSVIISYLLH